MQGPTQTKAQLHEACQADVARRIATVQNILAGINASRESETKSSVGDKYETGGAMLHREEAQASHQLLQALETQRELGDMAPGRDDGRVKKGSLVATTRATYYLAVGLGKVTLEDQVYYCVSPQSPIGRAMVNREVGDTISFNGSSQKVRRID